METVSFMAACDLSQSRKRLKSSASNDTQLKSSPTRSSKILSDLPPSTSARVYNVEMSQADLSRMWLDQLRNTCTCWCH